MRNAINIIGCIMFFAIAILIGVSIITFDWIFFRVALAILVFKIFLLLGYYILYWDSKNNKWL